MWERSLWTLTRASPPRLAPAAGYNTLACEDIAARAGVARLPLELRAGAAFLVRLVGGVHLGVDLGGVGRVTQGLRGRIRRIQGGKPCGGCGIDHETHGGNESAGDQSLLTIARREILFCIVMIPVGLNTNAFFPLLHRPYVKEMLIICARARTIITTIRK